MKIKRTYLVTGGLIAAVLCSPAVAQEVSAQTGTSAEAAQTEEDVVIVKGLRKSLQTAVDRKRRSAQIVDSVDAEDAGKLPDNNVNEAIARITGVQIERARGEGSGLKIRGMEDVQTTLNGAPNNTGIGRSASLNDIPAELLKSVQIYKNRTADQVEGGIAGTVNVDLRRPFDLPKKWTVAGSVRNVYADVGSTSSPYASALVSKRWDTPIGEIGFLANLSYQKNNYNEQWVTSESPDVFWGVQQTSLPVADQDAIAPYRVQNGIQHGFVERNSYNAAVQWRANENLDFLLEASGFNADEERATDFLEVRLKDSAATLSNLTYMPDGVTVKTVTETDPNPADNTVLPVGPYARDTVLTTRNSRINFEGHWRKDNWAVNFGANVDENRLNEDWYQMMMRMNNLASVNIDLASDKMAEVGPTVEFFAVGGQPMDFGDINNYYAREIENGKGHNNSKEHAFFFDANYRFGDTSFIRNIQVGARKTHRDVDRVYGYRYAGFQDAKAIKLANFPGGNQLIDIFADVPGQQSQHWKRMSLEGFVSNFDAIRALASNAATVSYGGGGAFDGTTGMAVPYTQQWATAEVQTERMMGTLQSSENTSAVFAQAFYGFDLFNVNFDGVVGARAVHTWGESYSIDRQVDVISTTPYAERVSMVPRTTELDYKDILPSAHIVAHFSPRLQLRFAYTQNVQRPNFEQATSFTFLNNPTSGIGTGWGGNANLKANREDSYDASLEYYFGRGGVVSFGAYLKKPDGFIYDSTELETVDGVQYNITRPRNASPGIFQGYEFNAQGFFEFLPGHWKNLGGQFNYSYNQIAKIDYPGDDDNAIGNSRFTYNAILYYDTPQFSARVAYNYRDRYRAWTHWLPQYSPYVEATSRLDAAVNWTPVKYMTLSVEGTNLLQNNTKMTWGVDNLLPQGIRVQARTIQVSARFRY